MAILSAQYSITATPTKVYLGDGATEVHIHCAAGSAYLGDSNVNTNSFKLDSGDKVVVNTHETDMWAVSANSATIYTLVLSK